MITRSTLTRMLSLVIIAIIASTSGFAQEAAPSQPTASPAPATITPFPVTRSVTDSAGRKLEGAILSKDADSIRFRRTSDGKEFDLPLDKLSPVDQSFIATLKAPATTLPPADNKPIKVLYTIPHDAVLVGDFYNLEALGKLGYEVTLTSYKLPPDGWIVNAITGSIPDSEPGQRPANLYTRTNKRLNPALKTILMDTVKTTDYDVLFLSMEKKAILDSSSYRIIAKLEKEFISTKKPVLKRDQNYRKMHGSTGTWPNNFLTEENGMVLYNDLFERDEKPPATKADDGSYDPKITWKILNSLKNALN